MRPLVLTILLATIARAQQSGPVSDPASLFPRGTPAYAECDAVSAAAQSIRGSALLASLPEPSRNRIDAVLAEVAALRIGRLAFGYLPALIGSNRWILVAEAPDGAAILAQLAKWRPEGPRPAQGDCPPFVVLADSKETIETVAALHAGTEKALGARDDFQRHRARCPGGFLRFHLDVGKLAPPLLRFGISRRGDLGAVLFGTQLVHVLKTARVVSGRIELGPASRLWLHAEVDPLPASYAFADTRPSQPVLAPPADCSMRLSLARDVTTFWNERTKLLSEAARAPLAEFQNNLSILMGGLSPEDVFAGMGSAFDVYVARGDSAAREGHRYPAAALVAVISDSGLPTELLLGFQTTIGIVNAQRAQEGKPRFFQESTRHRDVLVACARLLPGTLPDPADDRLQLEPSFATVKDRMILGTNRAIVGRLVDRVLDGPSEPRGAGDDLWASGPAAATALRDAAAWLRSQMVLKEGRTEDAARATLDRIADIVSRIDPARARFTVAGDLATLTVDVDAPALFGGAAETR